MSGWQKTICILSGQQNTICFISGWQKPICFLNIELKSQAQPGIDKYELEHVFRVCFTANRLDQPMLNAVLTEDNLLYLPNVVYTDMAIDST